MKVAVTSDVHLEFGPLEIKNDVDADVLVLSGDICVARDLKERDVYNIMEGTRSSKLHDFFTTCSENFKHVIYVAGNHEHYDGDFQTTYTKLKINLAYLKNIHVLDKESVKIDDTTFVGTTLWTDMNKGDPLTLFHMRKAMNDFKSVSNSGRVVTRTVPLYKKGEDGQYIKDEKGCYVPDGYKKKEDKALFSPEDAMEEHYRCVDFIKMATEGQDGKFVVCTHHTPSHQSCHPYYKNDELMNGGYHSNLEHLMLDRPQIKLWTHGHTHEDFDYMVGDTRVVCNPRGYVKYESRAANFKLKVFEV